MMFKPIELPEHGAADDAFAAPVANTSEGSAETLLARAFVQETHVVGLMTAGAASAVNYASQFGTSQPLIAASDLIAGFTPRIEQWPKRILSEQLSRDAFHQAAEFFAAFRNADAALREYAKEGSTLGIERAASLHIANLLREWRDAAQYGQMAIKTISEDAAPLLPEEDLRSSEILMKTLHRIVQSEPLCCGNDGTIVLPQLAERRRSPRKSLLQDARIRIGNKQFDAFARDISSGGLGLTRMPPFQPGMIIDVELACGRAFRGRIAWSRGEDAGMTFDEALSPTDPLIFG